MLEYEKKDYLHKKRLVYKKIDFAPSDHDHCELCWNRFSNAEGDETAGYFEEESKSWICESCFSDLSALFEWIVEG